MNLMVALFASTKKTTRFGMKKILNLKGLLMALYIQSALKTGKQLLDNTGSFNKKVLLLAKLFILYISIEVVIGS